jgi:hypothetical protein
MARYATRRLTRVFAVISSVTFIEAQNISGRDVKKRQTHMFYVLRIYFATLAVSTAR